MIESVRKWVQALMTLLTNGYWAFPVTRTIYQGPMKVICAPGLNCYSCPAASLSCPLGALQQMLANARFSLEIGQLHVGLYVVGCMGVLGSFFGRMICGWACPFGLIQELLHKIPSPKFDIYRPLRYIKFALLGLMVFLLPVLVVDAYGGGQPWFCKYLCPAGTLEAGLPMLLLQPDLRRTIGWLFVNKLFWMVLFVAWSVFASRPFCRTACPLGAFYALFSRTKLVKLRWHDDACTRCGACHKVCPMGVKFNESPEDTECISCLKCMNQACRYGAISLEIGGLPLRSPVGRKEPQPT
ncbi:MAG: 4Fe-4S binding protein [Thermodesulfobacteriota bacterium]